MQYRSPLTLSFAAALFVSGCGYVGFEVVSEDADGGSELDSSVARDAGVDGRGVDGAVVDGGVDGAVVDGGVDGAAIDGAVIDGAAIDANVGGVRIDRLTTDQPIFRASDDVLDDSFYLISTGPTQRPTSFVVGSRIYFVVPAKSNDTSRGGWHYALIHWAPGESEATWVDGAPEFGNQALLARTALDSNGFVMGNHQTTQLIQTDEGVLGLSSKFFLAADYDDVTTSGFFWIGVQTESPESLTARSFLVDDKDVINIEDNDGSWRGSTEKQIDLYFDDGEVLIYQTQINAPTNDTHYIALTRTTNMRAFTPPTEPLLQGYSRPEVFEYEGRYYMVAFSDAELRWQLIPGSGADAFDASAAQNIELGAALQGTGNWDDTPFFTDLPGGEPRLAGVDVLDGRVYLFYLAGSFGQLTDDPNSVGTYHGAPYDGPRGIGVFELTIP